MNARSRTLLAFAAVALVGGASLNTRAQNWETVRNYQYPGGTAEGHHIVADSSGNVFAGGDGSDAAGITRGLVFKTDTTQATWLQSDDTNPSVTQYESFVWNLGLDAAGALYSIGQLIPSSTGLPYWYVRKSSDNGATWFTLEKDNLYQYAPGKWINASGFAADGSGNIYVVGGAQDASKKSYLHWLVRKSSDGGQTWTLVDDVQGPTSSFGANGAGFVPGAGVFVVGAPFAGWSSSWLVRRSPSGQSIGEPGTWSTVDNPFAGAAQSVGSDSDGNIYVVGARFLTSTVKGRATTYPAWVTRKSSDGGNSWSTVDTFNYVQNRDSIAFGIGRNSAGSVVVAGRGQDLQGKLHWLVRTPDAFGTWQTMPPLDDFQLAPGYHASALGVATDAAGNLLVAGFADDATGSHWIVRRLASGNP
jgi:hypothetical protein